MLPSELIERLTAGPIHWFSDWPNPEVPRHGAVVYTIWDRSESFIYVGMSGRGHQEGDTPSGKAGPWGRLNSHAMGRRSGDQFCVYVCDRLVLPSVHNRLAEVAAGAISLDNLTRSYIRENLGYRWVSTASGVAAFEIERTLQGGSPGPLLNPVRVAKPSSTVAID